MEWICVEDGRRGEGKEGWGGAFKLRKKIEEKTTELHGEIR